MATNPLRIPANIGVQIRVPNSSSCEWLQLLIMCPSRSPVAAHKSPQSNLLPTAQSALCYFSNRQARRNPLTSGFKLKLKLNCDWYWLAACLSDNSAKSCAASRGFPHLVTFAYCCFLFPSLSLSLSIGITRSLSNLLAGWKSNLESLSSQPAYSHISCVLFSQVQLLV